MAQLGYRHRNRVGAEATSSPPMMVAAISAEHGVEQQREHTKVVVPEAMATGTIRLIVALITALRGSSPD